jgi:hypothetical protein
MRAFCVVGVGTPRGNRESGTKRAKLSVFWWRGLLLPLRCCARPFRYSGCEWNGTLSGKMWTFLLFDVGEIFWVMFRRC